MSVPVVLIVVGSIFLIFAFFGSGIKTKWGRLSRPLSKGEQIAGYIISGLFVIVGIVLFIIEQRALPTPDKKDKLDITGKVVDIFDNPRNDIIVITKGVQRYAITDRNGQYHLSNVPFQSNITLEAHYGKQKDNISITLDRSNIRGTQTIHEFLTLNPIKIEVYLCTHVDDLEGEGLAPRGKFEGENPRISLDSLSWDEEERNREIWCFVKVFGPLEYQVEKKEIFYEWYCNKELQARPYEQLIGFNPYGWRTRASKKVWAGQWQLVIKTKHVELARIPFEVYKTP